MGMAQLVVTTVLVEGRSKSEVARTYGISRRWVITLVQRYFAEGDTGLDPRSRRHHRCPTGPEVIEDEIIELRKDLDNTAVKPAPRRCAFDLGKRRGQSPAVSTIWRILTQRGFVVPQPHKRASAYFARENILPK